jgi:thioredoxin 1
MSANITHVSDASFEADVLKSDTPVLVDFWAEWCGPCKMIAPVLEEVAVSHAGKIKIAKLDVDENREIAAKYQIRGIPTLIVLKNGEEVARKVGALSKSQLTAFVDSQV